MLPNCVFRNSKSWDIYIYIFVCSLPRLLFVHNPNIKQIWRGYSPPLYRKRRGESETAWSGIMYIELPLIIVLQRQREMRRRWRRLPALVLSVAIISTRVAVSLIWIKHKFRLPGLFCVASFFFFPQFHVRYRFGFNGDSIYILLFYTRERERGRRERRRIIIV